MKYAKKLASFLLVLVMAFAMTMTTAFAAGNGSITVDNPQADQTYTAYKIFDVVYNTDQTAYSYTISGTSEWFDVVATKNADGTVTSKITGLSFQKAFSADTYVVVQGDGFSAASFANTLRENISGKSGTTLSVANGKATATGLDLGYYFVTSTSGALCNLTTTNPSVTIHDKNDIPFDKVDDQESVEVGEIVNYVITGKVPDTTGFTTYKYQITDKMSAGLTFNKDVKVYIDGVELTDTTKYTLSYTDSAKDFVLDIDVMKLTVGAKIEVKYSATVNDNAVAQIENNHAILEYSNDPTDSSKTTTREDKETVYSAKIIINKYAATDTTKKLAGAKFVLMNSEGKYYKYTAATADTAADVSWVDNQADATVVETNENGAGDFNGLKDGTYQLKEIAAPDGYNLLDELVTITINGANATTADRSSLTVTAGIANSTGTLLPSTGGIGTTVFYVIGAALAIGAVVLLVTRRRMSKKD